MNVYAWLALACAAFIALQLWDYQRRDAEYKQEMKGRYTTRIVLLALAMVLNIAAAVTG